MGLQLKGDNGSNVEEEKKNPWDAPKKEVNPWDNPNGGKIDLDYEEPKVVYNAVTAEAQALQKEGNPVVSLIIKIVIALAVCGLILFVGKQIVSTVMPEGIDITNYLKKDESTLQRELGETFTNNPEWASKVYEYSESDPTFVGSADLGVVYLDGHPIGVHIPSAKYTIFNAQVGDGEKHLYDNTTYPFDNFSSIVDTMFNSSTLYIYYSESRNDCIFILINNTTNRVESMTYYYNYKEVTEQLSSF